MAKGKSKSGAKTKYTSKGERPNVSKRTTKGTRAMFATGLTRSIRQLTAAQKGKKTKLVFGENGISEAAVFGTFSMG